jgi:polysaccharide biosynthesis transport protein
MAIGTGTASTGSAVGQPIVDLRDYLRAIWVRRWLIGGITLGVAILVAIWTLRQTPLYTAQARVLVLPTQNPALSNTSINPSQLEPVMTTEAELVGSDSVAAQVQKSTGTSTSSQALLKRLQVTPIPDSNIMSIAYSSPNPASAAILANAFARAYIDVRTQSRVAGITAALEPIQSDIAQTKAEIDTIVRRLAATQNPAVVQELKARRDAAQNILPILQQKASELETSATGNRAGELVQPARTPSAPTSPNLPVNVFLGILGGIALGLIVALALDAMDKRVRSREELERRIGAPVLAVIPRIESWREPDKPLVISQAGPKTPASEAFGTLATNIRYGGSQFLLRVVTITSSLPGEGKSATVANLGVALAQAGYRVIIVSGDLRRPRIHQFFGVDNEKGLTDAVSGSLPLSNFVEETGVPNLSLIPTGRLPDNPVAFLTRLNASGLLAEVRDLCDIAILDAPPILPVADSAILAAMSDGIVFVHNPERSSRAAVSESRERLRVAGARIVGVVYSNIDVRGRGRYYGAVPHMDLSAEGKKR